MNEQKIIDLLGIIFSDKKEAIQNYIIKSKELEKEEILLKEKLNYKNGLKEIIDYIDISKRNEGSPGLIEIVRYLYNIPESYRYGRKHLGEFINSNCCVNLTGKDELIITSDYNVQLKLNLIFSKEKLISETRGFFGIKKTNITYKRFFKIKANTSEEIEEIPVLIPFLEPTEF